MIPRGGGEEEKEILLLYPTFSLKGGNRGTECLEEGKRFWSRGVSLLCIGEGEKKGKRKTRLSKGAVPIGGKRGSQSLIFLIPPPRKKEGRCES